MWTPDPKVLFPLPSQTSKRDRYWLAAIIGYARDRHNPYRYVEVGSYLGGTLTPALMDERCRRVMSIDLRPATQPDARQALFDYKHVTTAKMLEGLRSHAGLDLAKLATFDGTVCGCEFGGDQYEVAFIDAEHTDEAVFADFLAVYPRLTVGAVCAFHDTNLITAGLENIRSFLRYVRRDHWFGVFAGSTVSAVALDLDPAMLPSHWRNGVADWAVYKEKSRDALLLEVVRNRCVLEATLKKPPTIRV